MKNKNVTSREFLSSTLLASTLLASSLIASCIGSVTPVKPLVVEVAPITTPSAAAIQTYNFSTNSAGTITYGGDCSSATTAATVGLNTITFAPLAEGLHSNCTITVTTTGTTNSSLPLAVTPFTIDNPNFNVTVVTPVVTPTGDTTPNIVINSTQAGTLTYFGGCSSPTTAISTTNLTITFNALTEGTYSGCLINVRGTASSSDVVISVPTFVVDTTKPVLAQVTAVPASSIVKTPSYTFSTTEAGLITYAGGCTSATTSAVVGNNTVAFNTLAVGTYGACTITVRDVALNTSLTLAITSFTIVRSVPLNDTGISLCGDYAASAHSNSLNCTTVGATQTVIGTDGDPVPAGQDAVFGRDSSGATNGSSDGALGFNYTKLDTTGAALAIQNGSYTAADAGTEVAGTKWTCVKDNVTNLVWEIKTDASSPNFRDKDYTYTWYNSTGVNTGNAAGTGDTGVGVGSDACLNNARCDTEKYVADVNAANICGETANDWRLPTAAELGSLRNLSRTAPALETSYFPSTVVANNYWTSTPDVAASANAWVVSANLGNSAVVAKSSTATNVRLVRGGN